MKSLFKIIFVSILFNSCTKIIENEILELGPVPFVANYSGQGETTFWRYEDDDGDEFEFEYYNSSSGSTQVGNWDRYINLFGGSYISEGYTFSITEDTFTIKTSEYYNYLTIIELVPYPFNFPVKDVEMGQTWTFAYDIEYTRYDQVTGMYEPNLVYPTTFNYSITGVRDSVQIASTLYKDVLSFKVEYELQSRDFIRKFYFANNIGLIYFDDQDNYAKLEYHY